MTVNDPVTTPKNEKAMAHPPKKEAPPRKAKGGFSTLVHNKEDTYVPLSGPSMKLRGQG